MMAATIAAIKVISNNMLMILIISVSYEYFSKFLVTKRCTVLLTVPFMMITETIFADRMQEAALNI